MNIQNGGRLSARVSSIVFLLALAACGRGGVVVACQGEGCCSEGTVWNGGICLAGTMPEPTPSETQCEGDGCCGGRTMFDPTAGVCIDPEAQCPEADAVIIESHFREDEVVPAGGTFAVTYNVYACRPVVVRSLDAWYAFRGPRETIRYIESAGLLYNDQSFAPPRPLALPRDSADVPFPHPIELRAGIIGSFTLETKVSAEAPSGQVYAILFRGMGIDRSDGAPAAVDAFIGDGWLQFEVQ